MQAECSVVPEAVALTAVMRWDSECGILDGDEAIFAVLEYVLSSCPEAPLDESAIKPTSS
jgi:hypothetical protein